jgi:hypothetical protein
LIRLELNASRCPIVDHYATARAVLKANIAVPSLARGWRVFTSLQWKCLHGDVDVEEMGYAHQHLMGCQEMDACIQFENYSMLCNNLSDHRTSLPLHILSIHAVATARH